MLQFLNKIYQNICKNGLIKHEEKVLASISGGQDSSCLLVLLYLLQTQMLFAFDLISFNHFWQKDSFFTQLHVVKSGYSFSCGAILGLPLTQVISEQSARDWRSKTTERVHAFYKYNLCVQGHTKTDRVETILLNLLRGTGVSGVSALQCKSNHPILASNSFYPKAFKLFKQTHFRISFESKKKPFSNSPRVEKPSFKYFKQIKRELG